MLFLDQIKIILCNEHLEPKMKLHIKKQKKNYCHYLTPINQEMYPLGLNINHYIIKCSDH